MKFTLPLSLVKPLRHLLFGFVKLLFYINILVATSLLQVQYVAPTQWHPHSRSLCILTEPLARSSCTVFVTATQLIDSIVSEEPYGVIQGLTYTDLEFNGNVWHGLKQKYICILSLKQIPSLGFWNCKVLWQKLSSRFLFEFLWVNGAWKDFNISIILLKLILQ